MRFCNSVEEFIDNYDLFIIDLWGVLHDGLNPYPNALKAFEQIAKNNKKIILLSNAPRRAKKVYGKLDELGFKRDWYQEIVTSGEVAFQYIKNQKSLGKKYFYIGPDKDFDILDGLDLQMVKKAADADFVIATGFNEFGDGFDTKKTQIDEALQAKLPFVCPNPDKMVVRQSGELMLCAGVMADYYENNGGEVIYFGKPYNYVYNYCIDIAGKYKNAVAIGDGIYTDIKGANNIGFDSVFITSGIASKALDVKYDQMPDKKTLEIFCEKEGVFPNIILPSLKF